MNPEENNYQQPQYQEPVMYQQAPPPPEPQPQQPAPGPAPAPATRNPLEAMRPGEQTICEVKRHPIGIIGNYVVAGFMIIAALVAAVAVPMFMKNASSGGSLDSVVWGICGLIILVAFVMIFIGNKVYNGNRWIVTSDSITQILQVSLFNTQTSQLSMGNIEDVTVEQNGILQEMFGFGLLRVETAGEHSKFVFPFCPNPNDYARKILNTREAFEQGRSGENPQRLYREQGAYAPPQNSYQGYPQPQPPQNMGPMNQQMPPMPPSNPPYEGNQGGGMPQSPA